MQKLNNRWIDDNRNSWDCDIYTKEQAIKFSETLVDCSSCHDCRGCSNCSYCRDCSNCLNCHNCRYCHNCNDCRGCDDCSYSRGCDDCRDCNDCRDCSSCRDCNDCRGCNDCIDCRGCDDCSNCINCSYCSYWEETPERIISAKIGSRNKNTTIYFNNKRTEVVCGCFKGTLKEFKDRITKTHGDNKHAKAYFAWLARVEKYIETR